ncbi:MAG: CinA family protein, partial [Kiritimatiellae bacterium]|nr:CinA family protein [Kiritimatiellia bacterium]
MEYDLSSLAAKLVTALSAKGLTCATAESCTGGGVGSAITSV